MACFSFSSLSIWMFPLRKKKLSFDQSHHCGFLPDHVRPGNLLEPPAQGVRGLQVDPGHGQQELNTLPVPEPHLPPQDLSLLHVLPHRLHDGGAALAVPGVEGLHGGVPGHDGDDDN